MFRWRNETSSISLLIIHQFNIECPLTQSKRTKWESRILIKTLNKIAEEGILLRIRPCCLLQYTHGAAIFTTRAAAWVRGPGSVVTRCGGEEEGAGMGRAGFSSERKGEVGTEEVHHCGGGIRGHRWTYSDTRLAEGMTKEQRSGRGGPVTTLTAFYVTLRCYEIVTQFDSGKDE